MAIDALTFARRHAARRAGEGVPLSAFLEAFRLSGQTLWKAAVDDLGEDATAQAAALVAARSFFDALSAVGVEAADAYLEFEQALRTEATGPRVLLERLLTEGTITRAAESTLHAHAGLEPGARCVVIVALHAPLLDPAARAPSARALIRAASGAVQPLYIEREDELVILRSVAPGELGLLSSRLREAQASLAACGKIASIGMSTAHADIATAPDAYAEARSAADSVYPDGGVQLLSEVGPLDYLAAHADEVAARLVPRAVRAFVDEDLDREGVLTGTVLAYAAASMSLARTAERLHIHVNTARYRLSRVSERTGYDLKDLADVLDLVVAIKMIGTSKLRESSL